MQSAGNFYFQIHCEETKIPNNSVFDDQLKIKQIFHQLKIKSTFKTIFFIQIHNGR